MPIRDNSSAAVRPVGPAPTIKTGSVMTSLLLARVAGVYENSPSRFVVNSACFIVFLRQNVVCRSGANEIDVGLRRGDFRQHRSICTGGSTNRGLT